MQPFPKTLIIAGILLVLVGTIWQLGSSTFNFGKLPGDISIEKPNFKFYFPLTTSIIISIILTIIFFLYNYFKN